jgi:CubicO group peptidase (beta-lactamase class C family)
MVDFVAWHGKSLSDHELLYSQAYAQGYRFLSISIYGGAADPHFAAVMVQPPYPLEQAMYDTLTVSQLPGAISEQAMQGMVPVMIAATGDAGNPLLTAIFQSSTPATEVFLFPPNVSPALTLPNRNGQAAASGNMLVWAASWGSAPNRNFLGIYTANPDNRLWGNQGLYDAPSLYQARFDAEVSVWCRPSFVTLNDDNEYLSIFVANEIGPWVGAHNMSADDYQQAFNTQTAEGLFPICVQAAGVPASSANYAAIFATRNHPKRRHFTATGPITNHRIDREVRKVMEAYPTVRHACLAIVNGTQLVYCKGYTLAERDWPIATDTTYFRLASVSKTITALAIFQFIESGQLALTDTMQSILKLQSPPGAPAMDRRFPLITIQQLLEHTSGLQTNAEDDGVQAMAQIGQPLPATMDQMDVYIASLPLQSDPGQTQAYSNCGYYLLGRVVAKLSGVDSPIAAYQSNLLGPLGITRIRSSVDLVQNQWPDEARYQQTDLLVSQSQQTSDRPLVAAGYGDGQLAIGQPDGGTSAAAPDLARLAAVCLNPNDSPGLQRATLVDMLNRAAGLTAAGYGRAGYGFDYVNTTQDPPFYAQKGGLLANAAGVFQFRGQWGFVLFFGCPAQYDVQPPLPAWYPDFTDAMNVARSVNWTQDLFTTAYGMAPL